MSKRQKTSKRPEPGLDRRVPTKPSDRRNVRKTGLTLRIGARTTDDKAPVRTPRVDISSSAFSERSMSPPKPPALSTLSARVITKHFALLSGEDHWESTREWLKLLPETIIPRLFSMLKRAHPNLLSHAVITTVRSFLYMLARNLHRSQYFLCGPSVALDGELGVTKDTLSALPRNVGAKLRTLSLNDFEKFQDSTYASAISKLPALEELNLRYRHSL